MTRIEAYVKNNIKEVAGNLCEICGVEEGTGKIKNCEVLKCKDCMFRIETCSVQVNEWLMKEIEDDQMVMGKWITNRLPEPWKAVLVTTENKSDHARFTQVAMIGNIDGVAGYEKTGELYWIPCYRESVHKLEYLENQDVVAWQPMPEPLGWKGMKSRYNELGGYYPTQKAYEESAKQIELDFKEGD